MVAPGLSAAQMNQLRGLEATLTELSVPDLTIDSFVVNRMLIRPLVSCADYVANHIPTMDPFNVSFVILDISAALADLANSAGSTGVINVVGVGNVSANGVNLTYSKRSVTFENVSLYYINVTSMALLIAENGTQTLTFDSWDPSIYSGIVSEVHSILDDNTLKIQSAPSVVHFREKMYNGTAIVLRDLMSPLMEGDVMGITSSVFL